MRLRSMLAGALAASATLLAPAASPAAVEFGSSLISAPGGQSCPGTCTFWNRTVNIDNPFVAPQGGILVSFTLKKAAGSWEPLHLRVIEPVGLETEPLWRGLAASTPEVTPSPEAGLQTFPARVPIEAGDYIGIEYNGPSVHRSAASGIFGALEYIVSPKLPAGAAPVDTTGAANSGFELLLRGRIEADADGDGFGDETQDRCPANPKLQGRCAPKCKKKRKKRAGRKAVAAKKKKARKCKRRKKRAKGK